MDKAALKKHEIYNNLQEFSEHELGAIADFIGFMKHKKHLDEKKVIKLEGVLKGCGINFSDLKKLKQETWNHVDEESMNG